MFFYKYDHTSSNINEVIKTVLNFFVFFTKRFHNHKKAQNAYKRTKIKNAPKKHQGENNHLFAYLRFVFLPFSAFGAFSACEIFS